MRSVFSPCISIIVGLFLGCAGSRQASETEAFFNEPGRYPAGPLNAANPRVGVSVPAVEGASGFAQGAHLGEDAAGQLLWVADRSARFNLVDRVRLDEMLSQQGLNGMLQPGDLLRPAALRGLDYVLLCRVSSLSVRGEDPPEKVSVANVENLLHVSSPNPKITATALVELRLIDPATGSAAAEIKAPFKRTGSPRSFGLTFATPEAAWGELMLNDEQASQVLRVVLDDAMRQFLPQVDRLPPATTASPLVAASAPASRSALLKVRCPECGFECTADDQFCPNCGARLPQNNKPPTK